MAGLRDFLGSGCKARGDVILTDGGDTAPGMDASTDHISEGSGKLHADAVSERTLMDDWALEDLYAEEHLERTAAAPQATVAILNRPELVTSYQMRTRT